MNTGREKFRRNKKILNILVYLLKFFPSSFLHFLWNSTSNHSELFFIGLRYIILKVRIKSCGDNVKIGTNVQIYGWSNLTLGSNVSLHSNCYIDANGEIFIGDNVSIAHSTSILSTNHDWSNSSIPIKYNPINYGKVTIFDDVWVGCGCRVLSGVTIRNRSIVAAGSVVNRDVRSNVIVGGVPAKVIKEI